MIALLIVTFTLDINYTGQGSEQSYVHWCAKLQFKMKYCNKNSKALIEKKQKKKKSTILINAQYFVFL